MKNQTFTIIIALALGTTMCKKVNEKNSFSNSTSDETNLKIEVNNTIESSNRSSLIWVENSRVTFFDKKTYCDFTERHLYNTDSVIQVITALAEYQSTRSQKPVNNNPGSEEYLDLILNGNNEFRVGNDILKMNFLDSLFIIKDLNNNVVSTHHFNSEFSYVDFNTEGGALRPSAFCGEHGVAAVSSFSTVQTSTSTGAFIQNCQFADSDFNYRLEYNKFGAYFTIVYKQQIFGLLPFNTVSCSPTAAPFSINNSNAREFQIGSLKPRCRPWQHKGPGLGSQSGTGSNWAKDRMYSSARALNKFHIRTFSDHPELNTSAMNSSNFQSQPNAIRLEIRKNM